MTEQPDPYDRIAHGYGTWWGPVLRPSAEALLELVATDLANDETTVVDVGTGTGTLALATVRRFPAVRVVATDASIGMLDAAARDADARLAPTDRARIAFRQAYAEDLPIEDAASRAVISSFVYQLVPSRTRALREAFRVLEPGGRLAYVTWLVGGRPWAPDDILDAVLDEAGFGPREAEDRPGDVPSAGAAASQLRRAGFRDVTAQGRELRHPFTAESYLGFVEEFDEEDTFASMSGRTRERARRRILREVGALSADERMLRLPIVYVTGRRPDRR